MGFAGHYDDAVVGAGILGLAHAYHLARRGRSVIVFERGERALGASVRNFGMLWPIGQPPGELHALALRSRSIWHEVLREAGLWHERTGSLHLAYRDDEAHVLTEFADRAGVTGFEVELLGPAGVGERSKAVRQEGLKLALWSGSETCVDPREVIAKLPTWLAREHDIRFEFGRAVVAYDRPRVVAGGKTWHAERLWVCAGDDFETLYPETYRSSGLVRCKLQMMRTAPIEGGWRLGPMLAAGSTLRHYRSFEGCPTLPALKARFARERPELDRFGIHVMASQTGLGEVTLGDSHEYGDAIDPFDKAEIDDLVLDYLATFLDSPPLKIASRWHGTYAKHPSQHVTVARPEPGVVAITGVGGAGMTLSFGLAERTVGEALGESVGS
jgi:FAD dependent oxidoreductase TIGR03364